MVRVRVSPYTLALTLTLTLAKVRLEEAQLAGGGVSHRGVSPVPKEALLGHAFHTYSLISGDGQVEFQFRHNVQGRSVYAEGAVDAVS